MKHSEGPEPLEDTPGPSFETSKGCLVKVGGTLLEASSSYAPLALLSAAPNSYTLAELPYSKVINKVVIYVTQGAWSSAKTWFANPRAGASAHYIARSADGFVGRALSEKDIAWHAGKWVIVTEGA